MLTEKQKAILACVTRLWEANPKMRFGQLLSNMSLDNAYHNTDEEILTFLKLYEREGK